MTNAMILENEMLTDAELDKINGGEGLTIAAVLKTLGTVSLITYVFARQKREEMNRLDNSVPNRDLNKYKDTKPTVAED